MDAVAVMASRANDSGVPALSPNKLQTDWLTWVFLTMEIKKDNRLAAFKRLEHLLYGMNYEVWFNLYGPLDPTLDLEQALKRHVSKTAQVSDISPSSPEEAKAEIMSMLLYEGDLGTGPINLDDKYEEVASLMNQVLSSITMDKAEQVTGFSFRKGHPAYPVFWDFSYDIHSNGKRWILIGSSSD